MADDEMDIPEIKKFKGLHPKHIIIDEILRFRDEDSPVNRLREEFYSNQLPTGYVPPFPLTKGEERLQGMNQTPESKAISEEYFKKDLPFPPLSEDVLRWRQDLRRHQAVKLDRDIIFGDRTEPDDVA